VDLSVFPRQQEQMLAMQWHTHMYSCCSRNLCASWSLLSGSNSGTVCCPAVLLYCRLQRYLTDMRAHMPPSHRAFLADLEAGPSVRAAVDDLSSSSSSSSDSSTNGSLVEAYNEAVHQLERFRAQHRGFAQQYIAQWSKKDTTGTGGSDFMPALTGFKKTTASFKMKV